MNDFKLKIERSGPCTKRWSIYLEREFGDEILCAFEFNLVKHPEFLNDSKARDFLYLNYSAFNYYWKWENPGQYFGKTRVSPSESTPSK